MEGVSDPHRPRLRLRLGHDAGTLARSHGEVTRAHTLHWRTHHPHPGGLHDPVLFGPLQAHRCDCGKFTGRQHHGITCDRCGVQIGHPRVRRTRSAHLTLATPCAHPLYPRELAHLLGWSPRLLADVLSGREPAPGTHATTGQAVWDLLNDTDWTDEALSGPRRDLVQLLAAQGRHPRDLMLRVLPVHPAGLRPVTDSARGLVKADLNDHYRRVLYAHDRLRRMHEIEAPELLIRTAIVQAQDAVTETLLFLARSLSGKTGRFRRTLLGKRVNFSARSVITPGVDLTLDEVGLPEAVARELFLPHLTRELRWEQVPGSVIRRILRDSAPLDAQTREALERVLARHVVLVNRAPTLHRQSLLAFTPRLVSGLTLRLHPMACEGLNADFDGDTIAVHLPLGRAAQEEARTRLTLRANLRSPASGELAVKPSKDMLLGLYRLSQRRDVMTCPAFRDADEAALAVHHGHLDWVEPCRVKLAGEVHSTTPGRAQVWQAVREATGDPALYDLTLLTKASTAALITRCLDTHGPDVAVRLLDALKTLGFQHATLDGVTVGIDDVLQAPERDTEIRRGQHHERELHAQEQAGLLTAPERERAVIGLWTDLKERVTVATLAHYRAHPENALSVLLESGARGSPAQVTQLSGLRGLMARADGSTFPTPILANFRTGLSATEFFISSHGARKGAADTALRTAQAGYLTRRLVNVLQDVRVTEPDCGTLDTVRDAQAWPGRTVVRTHPDGSQDVRSPLSCQAATGVCAACAGLDLSSLRAFPLGAAVGIIAAQSLGEPGTQLTMRTFHTGGVAGHDMTHGLQALVRHLEQPSEDAPGLARTLLEIYARQGVTLHPTHAELTARVLAGQGLNRARPGGGWLARAAARQTVPTLARAALHAESDPLTDLHAQAMTGTLTPTHGYRAHEVDAPPARWAEAGPGSDRLWNAPDLAGPPCAPAPSLQVNPFLNGEDPFLEASDD